MPEGNYENNKYQKQFLDSRFGQQFKGQTGYCKTTEYIREYSHWYYQMKKDTPSSRHPELLQPRCECGGRWSNRGNFLRHTRSKRHLKYWNNHPLQAYPPPKEWMGDVLPKDLGEPVPMRYMGNIQVRKMPPPRQVNNTIIRIKNPNRIKKKKLADGLD